TKAACAVERVARDRLQPVERGLRPAPQLRGAVGAVGVAGDVVARGGAAECEAAVAATRTLGDPTRVMDAHAQPRPCEGERARASCDAGANDGNVGPLDRARLDGLRSFVEPEGRGLHTRMLFGPG